MDEVSVRA